MRARLSGILIALTLFALLAVPLGLAAQDETAPTKKAQHHHYKLIDLGTFGGPQAFTQDAPQFLTNRGVVVGWADNPTPDPNYPHSCLFCIFGPFIFHAFRWNDGTLTDIGALPGVNSSAAFWIADNGLIAGFSENGEFDPLLNIPEIRAVLWKNKKLTDLGTLDGGYESAAFAVNTRGQVTGFSNNLVPDSFNPIGPTQQRTFLWDKKNGMQDLGTLGTGTDAGLLGFKGDIEINERGKVVACSYTNTTPNPATGTPTLDPFLWDEKNGMTDLGTLGGTSGCAVNLNNRGQVVGYSNLAGDAGLHPFLWTKPGPMHDLGTFGGNIGVAISINESSEAVGIATDQNGEFFAALWKDGTVLNLGTLDSLPNSNAQWINSKEQIVGFGASSDFSFHVAFLWENGGPMVDLNTLVPPNSKLQLSQALHINDRGEIAGTGTLPNGDAHNFLLIPCDDDHPDVEGCDYSIMDAAEASRDTSAPRAPQSSQLGKEALARMISASRNPLMRRYRLPGLRPTSSN